MKKNNHNACCWQSNTWIVRKQIRDEDSSGKLKKETTLKSNLWTSKNAIQKTWTEKKMQSNKNT